MFLSKKALGLEICRNGLRMAVLEGKREETPRLCAAGIDSFEAETLRFSQREPNILNPASFVAKVKETHLKLLTRVRRVSVSLPDSVGRVMLLDLETRFRNRDEGADIIRWKLKKSFPVDINDIHLDYQVLRRRETGETVALVALIAKGVVQQYEELLQESGLEPARIGFSSFSLYRLFARRLGLAENALFLSYFGRTVGILALREGILDFCRSKEIRAATFDPERVFREMTGSLLAYRERNPVHAAFEVFCAATGSSLREFRDLVAEAAGSEPKVLRPADSIASREDIVCDAALIDLLSASAGAAMGDL